MAHTHSPDAQPIRVAEPHVRQRHGGVDLQHGDIGVGIGADDPGAEAAAVGELHRDALGAVDDVLVGEEMPGGVDEEPGAGATPRRLAVARNPNGSFGGPRGRGRRRRDRDATSMLTTAGFAASATSAKLAGNAGAPPSGHGATVAGARIGTHDGRSGWRRHRRGGRQRPGDDRADQEADRGGEPRREPGEAPGHGFIISVRNSASSTSGTPRCAGLLHLATRLGADDHAAGLLADRVRHAAAQGLDAAVAASRLIDASVP